MVKTIAFILQVILLIWLIHLVVKLKEIKDFKDKIYQDKVWSWFIENADKFTFVQKIKFGPNEFCYTWKYGYYNIEVWIKDKNTPAFTFIHTEGYGYASTEKVGVCVLSGFNAYRSEELARLLMMRYYKEKLYEV